MQTLWEDVRYSLRTFRKTPGFSLVVILILGLAIGANTAIFSVVNGVLLKPLPYPNPDQLMLALGVWPNSDSFPMAPADFIDYRERSRMFSQFAVHLSREYDLAQGSAPERVAGMGVSGDFHELLGFKPLLGRTIERRDELEGNGDVAVLSHRFWQEKFKGSASVIGSALRMSGRSYTVIGVMPAGVNHPGTGYRAVPHGETVDVWTPLTLVPGKASRRGHFLNAIARMKPGVSREQAGAELTSIAVQLEKEYPDFNKDGRIRLKPLKEEIVGNSRNMLLVLLGAVGFVLLIACVNVANLLLVRSSARQRELAVRAALGAGRRRLARLALTESLLLATLGAALGILLAYWGVDALLALAKRQLPRVTSISIDGRVLGVALGVAFVTGILFGLAPVLQALRVNLNESLKQGRPTGSVHRRRLDGALVVTEIAVAFILLVGAGLLIRSFWVLQKQDPGFRPERVITATINLPGNKYGGPEAGRQFMTNLVSRLESQSIVEAAGISSDVPWTGYNDNSGFDIVGQPLQPGEVRSARYRFATPGYFKAMGVPAIQGRPIAESDHATAPPVVVINAVFAAKYFHGSDPVGQQLDVWGSKRTIAGVLADVKDTPAAASATPTFYFPAAQMPMPGMALSVRTKIEPTAAIETIRRTVLEVDPELALGSVRTMDQITSDALSAQRFTLALVILFAAVAAALAAIGIYGVIAYSVAQRIREFGIRIALGATRRDVLIMVLRHATKLGSIGISIGLVGALLVSKGLATLLYGVSERDPLTLVCVSILSAVIALLACSIPARRASRTEPVIALRHE